MIVDITHHMHIWDASSRKASNHLNQIVQWLSDNVGEYYGRGEGDVLRVGSGWEITAIKAHDLGERYTVSIMVDIDDGPKATWFAMLWGTR